MLKNDRKQENKKLAVHKVIYECACSMFSPVVLTTIANILAGILSVKIASILGEFTDAAFNLNLTLGFRSAFTLIICILAAVFAIPLIGLIGDFSMFKKSLWHDTLIFYQYLDKDPEKAMILYDGEIQYELEDAPNTLRIQWVTLLGTALSLPVCLGYLLYSAFKISWLLTLLMLVLASVRLLTPILFKRKLANYDRLAQAYNAKRRAYEGDITSKPYIIKLWGIKQPLLDRINQLFMNYYNKTESCYITCQVFSEQLREFVNNLTQILLFLFGAIMVTERYVTPGEFTSILVYLTAAQTFLNSIGDVIQNYPLLINAANRVSEFYQDIENSSGEHIEHFIQLKGDKVSFAFSNKEVFQNIDFSIMLGDKISIHGENGSGKSTLISIMSTLIKSYTGSITINNIDINDINIEDWRKIITYIPQIPCLFNTTVRENITMGNPNIDKVVVDKLMNEFGIFHLADRVIASDSELSGGEKQKISIARGLLRSSELLIMDEPSNHLDQASIIILKNYIIQTNKTVVLISHDLSFEDVVQKQLQI